MIYARRQLQALVRPAAHLGSPFSALRNGLGCSISEIDDRSGGATNCLEHPEQDWVTTLCCGTGARWLLRRRRRRLSTDGGGRSPPWGHELASLLDLSLDVLLPLGRFIVDRRSTFTGGLSFTHGHNAPVPLKRSAPASFKRLLGGTLASEASAGTLSQRSESALQRGRQIAHLVPYD